MALAGRRRRRRARRCAGPLEVDVAIVGAGYTGLWTAYHLKRADPALQIVVLEREVAGYGASGRNGGWVSGFFVGARARATSAAAAARAYWRCSARCSTTVDEVGRFLAEHGRTADFVKGGLLEVALNAPQLGRQRERLARHARAGSARRICASSYARSCGEGERAGRARRALLPARGARAARRSCCARSRTRSRRSASRSTSARPCSEIRAHDALTPVGARARALGGARHRGLHALAARAGRRVLAPVNSSMIITGRCRARLWVADRLVGQRDDERRGARCTPTCSARADGRDRDRRARRAVPLRLAHRRRRRDVPRATVAQPAREAASRCSPTLRGRAARARVVGRARRAARLVPVGRRRPRQRDRLGGRLRRRGSRRLEPRRAHAARPAARARQRADAHCPGSGACRAPGSPSRCAGPAIRGHLRALPRRRPRASSAAVDPRAWRACSTCSPHAPSASGQ